MPPKCIHELEATVTKKMICSKKKTKKKKEVKKDDKTAEAAAVDEWTPVSISQLKECEKKRVRPMPLHLESLISYFAASYKRKPRATEETVGLILYQTLSDKVVGGKDAEKHGGTAPFVYCRVCDLVFSSVDSFLDHSFTDDHIDLKMNDSIPFFDEVGGDYILSRNQLLSRELMGPALLHLPEESELEDETAIEMEEEEEEGSLIEESALSPTPEWEKNEGEEEGADEVTAEEVTAEEVTARTFNSSEEVTADCATPSPVGSGDRGTPSPVLSDVVSDVSSLGEEEDGVGVEVETVEAAVKKVQVEQAKAGGAGRKEGHMKITADNINVMEPKFIVDYRLQERPCVECSRIWDEYGGLISTTTQDLMTEFAFRCHPIHPCVALLKLVIECFKANLEWESDEAVRATPSKAAKYPSKEVLKELTADLEAEVDVLPALGHAHSIVCDETYQVSMHFRAEEVRAIYDKLMKSWDQREAEGRTFCCDICRVLLPTARHFRLHLLSDGHDKKMGQAPMRQSTLYNPLCQMVCFIDALTLMARKKVRKIEKKEEKKQTRLKKEKEDHKLASPERSKKKEEARSRKAAKKQLSEDVLETLALEPVVTTDRRGFPVVRWNVSAEMKAVKVIRRERTESEKACEDIVHEVW